MSNPLQIPAPHSDLGSPAPRSAGQRQQPAQNARVGANDAMTDIFAPVAVAHYSRLTPCSAGLIQVPAGRFP